MARLIKISDPDKPVFELRGEVLRIGRFPDNDVVLSDALASRRHAEVRKQGDHYRVVDLKSLNGIYVNNLKVEDEQLSHGDVIAIGEARFFFDTTSGPASPAPSPLPPRDPRGLLPPPKSGPAPAPAFSPALPGLLGNEIVKPINAAGPDHDLEVLSLSDIFERQSQSKSAARMEINQSRSFFILYQVARALNSINDLQDLLELTLTLIFQVVNAERGVIFLYNDKGELVPALARSKSGGDLPEINVSRTITQRAIEQKSALITADACYDPRFKEGASIIAYNIRSALCVPLWDREKTRGAIYLDNHMEAYAFTEDDLDLTSAIANQVAIAAQREEMQKKMRESAIFRANLERFHSPDVVNHIMQQSREETPRRSLDEREVTILFADIVDFTPLLERLSPQEAADLLTDFFDEMTEIIFKHKGTIDKFIGDCIMAIFGAPIFYGNDAELAVFAAIDMMKRMEEFKARRRDQEKFDLRIGINTGMVAAGYLGSKKRIEYSVLGDPVNVASRLESAALPGTIIVGEATYSKVKGTFAFKYRGSTILKGKKHETKIYEVSYK
jgi:adenylate cyclase